MEFLQDEDERKRKRSASRKAPEIVVSRPAMQPSIENPLLQHPPPMVASPLPFWDRNLFSASNFPHSTTSMLQDGLSTPIFSIAQSVNSPNVSAIGSVISLSSTINSNVGSIVSAPSAIVDSATTARHLASSNNLQPACNTNPFFVRLIVGNIRVCQGCRSSLRSTDGTVPMAPFDLVIARFERRPYRDKTGELKTPTRDQAAHYHLKVGCVESGSPSFVPANLFVPPDVYPLLTPIHKEYLRIMFGIQFLL